MLCAKSRAFLAVLKTVTIKSPYLITLISSFGLLLPGMKYTHLLIALILFTACGNEQQKSTTSFDHFYAPAAGTVVAADSTPIKEDELNDFYFSVRITTIDSSTEGAYILDAAYGVNEAQTRVIYPKLDRQIHPAIRLDTIPYSYVVGFHYNGSDTFKDYARVSAKQIGSISRQIEIKYLKAYFMDSTKK